MKKKQLSVRLHGEQVGILEQLQTGKLIFTYDADAKTSISYSMPIENAVYHHAHCEAYFGGLLPESETVKKIIARQYGISAGNIFALLKAIGHDCAGAISFHEMNDPIAKRSIKLNGKKIDEKILYEHIKALPQKPLFLGFNDLRLSLAGVHDKAAVCLIDNEIVLPKQDCPTTHILKPETSAFSYLCENEFICMHLAKTIGLTVPTVTIKQLRDITYLLIERFDRVISRHSVTRIHQEDFCQALAIPSIKKYQNEGGPSLKDSFELLTKTTQPVIDRNALASIVIFNFLIGNCDAHGKNFSLLHHQNEMSLSPFYDLVSTIFYPTLSKKMAMKIGSEYQINRVDLAQWEKLCHAIQYNFPHLKKLIQKMGQAILQALEKNKDFYMSETNQARCVNQLCEKITVHISHVLRQYS